MVTSYIKGTVVCTFMHIHLECGLGVCSPLYFVLAFCTTRFAAKSRENR